MSEVGAKMGKTPHWVMKNFTFPQLFLFYRNMKKVEADYTELQARYVWAVANGWKKPKEVSADNVNALKATGMLQEG